MAESKPSKSALKRQSIALQHLGEMLIALTDTQMLAVVTEPRLIDALRQARSIRSHGALRRQKQLIGKLMRDLDPEPIQLALDALHRESSEDKRIFKEAERWRDRLCADPVTALADFRARTGDPGRELAQRLQEHSSATGDTARKTLYRQIFREIHRQLLAKMQSRAG